MIEQIVIGICGVTSVFLSQDKKISRQRWACIFGLFAQPFWMYAAFIAEQWGIFILAFLYTWGWARGVKTYWMNK